MRPAAIAAARKTVSTASPAKVPIAKVPATRASAARIFVRGSRRCTGDSTGTYWPNAKLLRSSTRPHRHRLQDRRPAFLDRENVGPHRKPALPQALRAQGDLRQPEAERRQA